MASPNSMIVRGRSLPAPPATLQRYFGGETAGKSRQLKVDGFDTLFELHPVFRPFLTIGRSAECDILLDHAEVSYRHAHLQLVAGQIYFIDLASRTGTFWDGVSLPSGWLMAGQTIRIGPFALTAVGEAPPVADQRVTRLNLLSHEVADSQIELEFLNGRHKSSGGKLWSVKQPITLIGSSPQCRLRLKDGSVSRVHCSLMATPAGVWVTDLLGRGGTQVNGDPVTFQLLQQDDELQVGRFRFGIRYRNEESAIPSDPPFQASAQPAASRPADNAAGGIPGVSEGFVISMMDRFMEMQQQMSAINHQQMMFMAQLVGSMHQNHHELAQKEMTQIAEIEAEIKKLQTQAAAEGIALPVTASPTAAARLPEFPGVLPHANVRPHLAADQSTLHGFSSPEPKPVETPAAAAAPQAPRQTARDVNSHSHLIERMATLEKERNSRWKKLVGLLTGSGS